jgi:ParB family chromosome partitioning protein
MLSRADHRLQSAASENRIRAVILARVLLRKISLRDERFRTSYFFDLDPLIRSIRRVGLASPPLLRTEGIGFIIVSGWKRVLACRELGLKEVAALITEKKNDLRLFLRALEENLAARRLGPAEQAEVILKLRQLGLPDRKLLRTYLPLLGLPATADRLESVLALAGAEDEVKRLVEEKDLPPHVVESILRFGPTERRRLLPLLRPLGQNKQKELLDDLWEIGRRDGIQAQRILRRAEVRQAVAPAGLSPLQRAERVRRALKKLRYPRLSAREEAFAAALRRIGWPKGVDARPAPFFEDRDVTVSFRFRSREELRACLDKLAAAAGRETVDDLFRE